MAAVQVDDDGVVVICMGAKEAAVLVETLVGRKAHWINTTIDDGWNLAQQILYERDRTDRLDGEGRRRDRGCVACQGSGKLGSREEQK
jgi:hypothetical protein